MDGYPDPRRLEVSVDQTEALALLKKGFDGPDRDGWTPLEESISQNITNAYLE